LAPASSGCRGAAVSGGAPALANGRVEAINGLIQAAKAKARGYGTTRHLITIAYLVAGKLTHLPGSPFKLQAGATACA
jgi:hypothetical protein